MRPPLPEEKILPTNYEIGERKVVLEKELTGMYWMETRAIKQALRRNPDRFPDDFMFELTPGEWDHQKAFLRSQNATLKERQRGIHRKFLSFAFTEQGVARLSSVPNSKEAISGNIHIMRVFVKVQCLAAGYSDLLNKIQALQESDPAQNEGIEQLPYS